MLQEDTDGLNLISCEERQREKEQLRNGKVEWRYSLWTMNLDFMFDLRFVQIIF
jgi:hypothetical protein